MSISARRAIRSSPANRNSSIRPGESSDSARNSAEPTASRKPLKPKALRPPPSKETKITGKMPVPHPNATPLCKQPPSISTTAFFFAPLHRASIHHHRLPPLLSPSRQATPSDRPHAPHPQ